MHVIIVEADLNLRTKRVQSLPQHGEYKGASITFVSTAAAAVNELSDRKRQEVRILADNILHTPNEYRAMLDRPRAGPRKV